MRRGSMLMVFVVVVIVTGLVRVNLSVNFHSASGSDGVAQASHEESDDMAPTDHHGPMTSPKSSSLAARAVILALGLLAASMIVDMVRSPRRDVSALRERSVFTRLLDWIGGLNKSGKSKRKRGALGGMHGRALAIERAAREKTTDFAALGLPDPVLHDVSTYVLGDMLFDDTFAVERPGGPTRRNPIFLGQCGVSVAVPVNIYDPGRVAALEVWLFDQYERRTTSVILASEHALRDSALRRALYAKSPALIAIGEDATAELDTGSLRLRLRVLSLGYGFSDTLAPRSFLDYASIELAVWQK